MNTCECGCGGETKKGLFLPGHDQRLRSELEKKIGGLLNLRTLVETAEQYASGAVASDELLKKAKIFFPESE